MMRGAGRYMIEIFVEGTPAPKGSKVLMRGRMIESSRKVAAWEDAVAWALKAEVSPRNWDSAIYVGCEFYLPRPQRPQNKTPITRPDIDKLVRATLDGITRSGVVWRDDAQVCRLICVKRYTDNSFGGEKRTGAKIVIMPL
jgi:Holliday junction resolvase RusA-like endonuclease